MTRSVERLKELDCYVQAQLKLLLKKVLAASVEVCWNGYRGPIRRGVYELVWRIFGPQAQCKNLQ